MKAESTLKANALEKDKRRGSMTKRRFVVG